MAAADLLTVAECMITADAGNPLQVKKTKQQQPETKTYYTWLAMDGQMDGKKLLATKGKQARVKCYYLTFKYLVGALVIYLMELDWLLVLELYLQGNGENCVSNIINILDYCPVTSMMMIGPLSYSN